MTDTPQSPAPAQAGDAERLAEIRAKHGAADDDCNAAYILRLLDARDARIAG